MGAEVGVVSFKHVGTCFYICHANKRDMRRDYEKQSLLFYVPFNYTEYSDL